MFAPYVRLPENNQHTSSLTTPYPSPTPLKSAGSTGFQMEPNEFPPFPSLPHNSPINRPLMDPGDMRLDAGAWGAKMSRRLSERLVEARTVHFPPDLVDGDSCGSDNELDENHHRHVVTPSPTKSEADAAAAAELLTDQFAVMEVESSHTSDHLGQHFRPVSPSDDVAQAPASPVAHPSPTYDHLEQHFCSVSPSDGMAEAPVPSMAHSSPIPEQGPPLDSPGEAYWRACAEHWYNTCIEMQRHVSHICHPLNAPNMQVPEQYWYSMCTDMQRHVSLICGPLATPTMQYPYPN